jgi:hypothetical protein
VTNYYVSKSGNNGNAGTSTGAAWLTLAHAYATITAGDTLFIRGGASYAAREIWNEAVSLTTAAHDSGTALNPIVIRNYPGEFIELQNSTGVPFYLRGLDYWQYIGTTGAGAGLVASGTSGVALSPFTVTARQFDATTATDYTGTITVSLSSGSGVLSGTLAVAAVAGVATFGNVIITGTGDHTLVANGT